MSKYKKPFIAELKKLWSTRQPLWRPGICAPVFWAYRDSTFTNDYYLAKTGLIYHAVINFSTKDRGSFTCDVVITPSLAPLEGNPPSHGPEDIAALPIGTFRIGWFLGNQDIWWDLVDEAAETNRILGQIPGLELPAFLLERNPNHWQAKNYEAGLAEVIREAAENFSDTFERYVAATVEAKGAGLH